MLADVIYTAAGSAQKFLTDPIYCTAMVHGGVYSTVVLEGGHLGRGSLCSMRVFGCVISACSRLSLGMAALRGDAEKSSGLCWEKTAPAPSAGGKDTLSAQLCRMQVRRLDKESDSEE